MATLDRVEPLLQSTVVGGQAHELLLETPRGARHLHFESLVLATGARELLLPFPGWTLPGVTGAGGLQALAKQGWPLAGKRVVVAGSGPLLLAAAATLRQHGARVLGIHEQAPADAVHAFALQLWRWPARVAQATALRMRLAGVPYRFGSFVRAAQGDCALRSIAVEGPHGIHRIECDQLAIGYGLVPNTELAELLGCALSRDTTQPCVQVDALLRTNVDGVYAAGEACGIGGLAAARIEGRIAGHAAAGAIDAATALLGEREHERRFARLLARHFAVSARMRQLADADTIICRCEDVRLAALDGFDSAREAKLATRCGMGACQGRICGTALAEMARFPRGGMRPPLFPARLATLASTDAAP
jgi:NADPH-dependent 2,4-dienoyl-CoA reductase/sulfur reductase-like enzyme